jgi:ubiquinone/menaquinone biosynthesis C-methylase UbiE
LGIILMSLNPLAIFSRLSPRRRSFFFRYFYRFLAQNYRRPDWKFMNYGFAPLDGEGRLDLEPGDEYNRAYIQLYDHLVSAVTIQGKEVLEVGCGRGGGADFVTRYLKPRRMVGLDLSPSGTDFCCAQYDLEGLSFEVGDAENLPYPDQSFDVVINVESSHCYGSVATFFDQVFRVLRNGGYFLFADFRRSEDLPALLSDLETSGLIKIREQDITPQILKAMEQEMPRRTALIEDMIPKPLVRFSHQFAGTPGSRIHDRFQSGESAYLSFVLQKPF